MGYLLRGEGVHGHMSAGGEDMKTREELVAGYDRLALEYAAHYCDELDREPYDGGRLRRCAEGGADGTVGDVGCGPGHIAACLDELGTPVIGGDLSPHM